MAAKKINPIVKMVLEFGPIILFFIGFSRFKDQVFVIGGTEYSALS